jgi:hypothetical protein
MGEYVLSMEYDEMMPMIPITNGFCFLTTYRSRDREACFVEERNGYWVR